MIEAATVVRGQAVTVGLRNVQPPPPPPPPPPSTPPPHQRRSGYGNRERSSSCAVGRPQVGCCILWYGVVFSTMKAEGRGWGAGPVEWPKRWLERGDGCTLHISKPRATHLLNAVKVFEFSI
jgi:hypothetical protein